MANMNHESHFVPEPNTISARLAAQLDALRRVHIALDERGVPRISGEDLARQLSLEERCLLYFQSGAAMGRLHTPLTKESAGKGVATGIGGPPEQERLRRIVELGLSATPAPTTPVRSYLLFEDPAVFFAETLPAVRGQLHFFSAVTGDAHAALAWTQVLERLTVLAAISTPATPPAP